MKLCLKANSKEEAHITWTTIGIKAIFEQEIKILANFHNVTNFLGRANLSHLNTFQPRLVCGYKKTQY